jgi:hypothetical protein
MRQEIKLDDQNGRGGRDRERERALFREIVQFMVLI